MFGTIKPCKRCLSGEQNAAYKAHYCGLCFALHENFGKLARLFLNYDLTNDLLLCGSCRGDGEVRTAKCPWSWYGKRVSYIVYPELSDYFARLNYILVYHNLLDDVQDEGSLTAKWLTRRMEEPLREITPLMEKEIRLLREYLARLSAIETENALLPVMSVARHFGQLLKDMVKPPFADEMDADVFSAINYWTGIWVYTMDAILDCLGDGLKKQYNPILAGLEGDPLTILRSRKQELLDILGACRQNILMLLDTCPTWENGDLLRSLFSGQLPKIVCIYLEVEKDELISQSKAAASGGLPG